VTYRKLGASLIRMQRYDEATTLFDQLRERRPQSATPLLGHAAIALAQRDTAGARTHFLAALEQDSRNIEARQSLAVLAEQDRQNPAEALRWCREIHEIAPATPGNADCIARSETQLSNTPATPIDIR
jgi:Flp pilus assembly protein TadD